MEFHETAHKCSEDDYLLLEGHILSSELIVMQFLAKNNHFWPKKVLLISVRYPLDQKLNF